MQWVELIARRRDIRGVRNPFGSCMGDWRAKKKRHAFHESVWSKNSGAVDLHEHSFLRRRRWTRWRCEIEQQRWMGCGLLVLARAKFSNREEPARAELLHCVGWFGRPSISHCCAVSGLNDESRDSNFEFVCAYTGINAGSVQPTGGTIDRQNHVWLARWGLSFYSVGSTWDELNEFLLI